MDAPLAAAVAKSHDPSADLGPALAGALAGIAPLRAHGGRLHLTVSLPVDHRRLQALTYTFGAARSSQAR